MTKLPFSRLLLSAALASVTLTGCDIDDSTEQPASPFDYGANIGGPGCNIVDSLTGTCALIVTAPDYFVPGTHPRFNPAISDLPLNNDILFSGTMDGTAAISGTDAVRNAINDLDGWSVSAAFNIGMSASVDPASVSSAGGLSQLMSPTQNVFLLPLESVAGGDALDPADINAAAPFNNANIAATAFQAAAVSLDGGTNNAIRITPTAPLMAKKKYLVIVTNGITDGSAAPITASANYDLLGSAAPLANASLLPLRTAITGWEQLAVGFLAARNAALNAGGASLPTDPAVLRSSLALTYTFTTTDPNAGMLAMAAPRAAIVQAAVGAGAPPADGVLLATQLQAAGLLSTPKASASLAVNPATAIDLGTLTAGAVASGVGDIYTGAITLPYYQATPLDTGFFTTGWTADQVLGSQLSTQLGQTVPPADTDGSYNVTYRYPFAGKRNATGAVKVPLQVTLPDPAFVPKAANGVDPDPAFGGASCGQVQAAQSGYPVVIYVHGITSDRASVAALAHSLASKCAATVAIDLPMHGIASSSPFFDYLNVQNPDGDADPIQYQMLYPGVGERHFNLKAGATGAPVPMAQNGTDGSGTLFINLGYGVNSRDNIRQAVMDLLNLNASLGNISALNLDGVAGNDLNLNKVYLVGVSLGGIVGSVFTTVNQQAIGAEASLGFSSNLNPIKGAVLSAAGSQLTKVLENSQSFSPVILGGLAASGVTPGTENFERFMYVLQSMIDPADPVSYAKPLAALDMPLLLQEIVGGGDVSGLGDTTVYVADKVVPNNAIVPLVAGGFTAPLAGTDPLATLLGLSGTTAGTHDATATPLLVRLAIGHHSSLLRSYENAAPATTGENIATSELQTQVVSFVLTGGTGVKVGAGANGLAAGFIAN